MKRITVSTCVSFSGIPDACSNGKRRNSKIGFEKTNASVPAPANDTRQIANVERNSSRCSQNDISPDTFPLSPVNETASPFSSSSKRKIPLFLNCGNDTLNFSTAPRVDAKPRRGKPPLQRKHSDTARSQASESARENRKSPRSSGEFRRPPLPSQ